MLISEPSGMEELMSQVRRAKTKRSKTALSVFGLAGISLAATTAATTNESLAGMPSPATAPVQAFTLGEEEISDVTLATFHLFDKDSVEQSRSLLHLTACRGGCGCGGRGCGGCRGGGCRVAVSWRMRMQSRRMRMQGWMWWGGCGGGCGGCGCGGAWCLSWGGCRPWC